MHETMENGARSGGRRPELPAPIIGFDKMAVTPALRGELRRVLSFEHHVGN